MSFNLLLSLAVFISSCLCSIRAANLEVCRNNDAFMAAFQASANRIVDNVVTPGPDAGLKFLRNVMFYSDEEIEEFTNDAIRFYNESCGLDFSEVEADENGARFLAEKNATLSLFELNPDVNYHAVFNRWLINGRQITFCIPIREGGYSVSFGSEQMLFGTYGGEEGRPIRPGDLIDYLLQNIPVCPQSPIIIIQIQSRSPIQFDPFDGFGTLNDDTFHNELGQGISRGDLAVVPAPDNKFLVTLWKVLCSETIHCSCCEIMTG